MGYAIRWAAGHKKLLVGFWLGVSTTTAQIYTTKIIPEANVINRIKKLVKSVAKYLQSDKELHIGLRVNVKGKTLGIYPSVD